MRRLILILLLLTSAAPRERAADLWLPLKPNSVRLAVIGDSGTGEKEQFEVARQMTACHSTFPFDFVVMLGDNIYGGHEPSDFKRKFEDPYAPLLDVGVKFYASLGNHDATDERFYKPFNMDGKRYRSFKRGNAEFFVLDSNYMDPDQLAWLEKTLTESNARYHNLRPSGEIAKGFDTDRVFALMEIAGDELYFRTVSRAGDTVDTGVLPVQIRQTREHTN